MSNEDKFVFYAKGLEAKSFYDEKADKTRYIVKGYVDDGEMDLVNDIVTKSCMEDLSQQFKSRSIKLDFDHETLRKAQGEDELDAQLNLSKMPLGKAINENLTEKGNEVTFELNPDWKKLDKSGNVSMTFDEVWNSIKSGFYDAFSIAYIPVKTAKSMVNNATARLLDKVNLVNVALTGNPINPGATMTKVMAKSLDYMKEKEGGGSMQQTKSQVLDVIIGKVASGKQLNKKEEKLLSSALDVANDDEAENTLAEKIMSKISQGLRLSIKEERILSALLDAEREENAAEMAEKSNKINGKGGNMPENEKGNNAPEGQGQEAKGQEGQTQQPEGQTGQTQGQTNDSGAQAKSQEQGQNQEVDAKSFAELKSEVSELKSTVNKLNEVMEKALPAGYGPESKSEKEQARNQQNAGVEEKAKEIGSQTLNFI